MFTTAKMSSILVAGTLKQLGPTLQLASKLNSIHIVDYDGSELGLGSPDERADKISKNLAKMRGCAAHLKPSADEELLSAPVIRRRVSEDLSEEVDNAVELIHRLENLENEIEQNIETISVLNILAPLGIEMELMRGYDSLEVSVGTVPSLSTCRLELNKFKEEVMEISSNMGGKEGIMVIFAKKGVANEVQTMLASQGFQPLQIPTQEGSPSKLIQKLEEEEQAAETQIAEIGEKLDGWREKHGGILLGGMELLERDLNVYSAPIRVAVSEHAFVLDGWIKTDEVEQTVSALSETSSYIEVEEYVAKHGHHPANGEPQEKLPPVAFTNPEMAQPYELLTDAVGRPHYGRVDPTSFMFITYPIFFGIMLGDLAYGLAIIGLAWWINSRFGRNIHAKHASKLLYYIGASTAVFGIIFGEVLGFDVTPTSTHAPPWLAWMAMLYPEHHVSLHLPLNVVLSYPFHRVGGNLQDLIIITLYMGVAHLALGILIGFRDVLKEHGLVAAIFEKGSWMLVLGGGFFAVYAFIMSGKNPSDGYAELLAQLSLYGGIVLAIGIAMVIIMLWKYEDIPLPIAMGLGPLESLQILSNTISYVRLFAVGIVGVKIAELGNEKFFEPAVHAIGNLSFDALSLITGIITILLLIVLWVSVQIFALVLGLFSPNVQAARLHFVEWMGKFYEVGGEAFDPFGNTQNYVEVE